MLRSNRFDVSLSEEHQFRDAWAIVACKSVLDSNLHPRPPKHIPDSDEESNQSDIIDLDQIEWNDLIESTNNEYLNQSSCDGRDSIIKCLDNDDDEISDSNSISNHRIKLVMGNDLVQGSDNTRSRSHPQLFQFNKTIRRLISILQEEAISIINIEVYKSKVKDTKFKIV